MRTSLLLCIFASALPVAAFGDVKAVFLGGPDPAKVQGGGNIVNIFNAAVAAWETAIPGISDITIEFGWAPISASGQSVLLAQGGSPERPTYDRVLFNSNLSLPWFLDPTPMASEEYTAPFSTVKDLGGGPMVVGQGYFGPTGSAVGALDLFSVAEHEIGHALGLSASYSDFAGQSQNGAAIYVTAGPFAGATLPLVYGPHLDPFVVGYGSVMSGVNADERRLLSDADIWAVRQVSGYLPDTVIATPEPSSIAFLLGVLVCIYGYRRRKVA